MIRVIFVINRTQLGTGENNNLRERRFRKNCTNIAGKTEKSKGSGRDQSNLQRALHTPPWPTTCPSNLFVKSSLLRATKPRGPRQTEAEPAC